MGYIIFPPALVDSGPNSGAKRIKCLNYIGLVKVHILILAGMTPDGRAVVDVSRGSSVDEM